MQSLPCIEKKEKKNTASKMLLQSFTILAHVFIIIAGSFCVKHTFNTCVFVKINQTLSCASTWTEATAEAAILESVVNPNLTSEKITGETSAMVHIPHCWYVYSWQYSTSFDLSTKSTLPCNNNYKYFCGMFTSHETIYRPTSLMISGATWASTGPRLTIVGQEDFLMVYATKI